jgi:lipoprotein Spr
MNAFGFLVRPGAFIGSRRPQPNYWTGFCTIYPMRRIGAILIGLMVIFSCNKSKPVSPGNAHILPPLAPGNKNHYITVETGKTKPAELVAFARSLEGTPYEYGSADPDLGFDCSGFVTYVFNHFGIRVPRPSADFTFVNREIDITQAKPGDLILFTGTEPMPKIVGHLGIIRSNNARTIIFIHSTSGDACGIVESAFDSYYQHRYIKTLRVFPQNDRRQTALTNQPFHQR